MSVDSKEPVGSKAKKAYWASPEGRLQAELMKLNYTGRENSKETREKIKKSVRAWYESEEGQEWCRKRSEEQKGKVVSEETRQKISEKRLAHLDTDEGKATVEKWAAARRGKKLSKEHLAKIVKTKLETKCGTLPFTLIIESEGGDVKEVLFDSNRPYNDFIDKYGYAHKFKALKDGETVFVKNKSNKHTLPRGTKLSIRMETPRPTQTNK